MLAKGQTAGSTHAMQRGNSSSIAEDNFTWSNALQSGREASTTVAPRAGELRDHLLSDVAQAPGKKRA